MSQEPSGSAGPPDDEKLSGTLFGGFRNVSSALAWASPALATVGVASLVLGVILLLFLRDLRLYSYIIIGVGSGLTLVSMIFSFDTVSRAIISRRGRYGTNTTIMVGAFIGVVAVVNFLAFEHAFRSDLTATKQFSLAPGTEDLLKSLKDLDERVEAKVFFGPATTPQDELLQNEIRDLLDEFELRTDRFSYEFVDPDLEPLTAAEYGIDPITGYGNVVFESMGEARRQIISPAPPFLEQGFVTGLLIVTEQGQKRVYFLTGHGEKDIREEGADGFSFAVAGVAGENYAPETLDLSLDQGRRLESDRENGEVNMLVVAGPTKDLEKTEDLDEAGILDDYLRKGGNALFLLEPNSPQSFRDFLARWGVIVEEGHIVDQARRLAGPDNEDIPGLFEGQYLIDDIPAPLDALRIDKLTGPLRKTRTYFPGLASVKPADKGVLFFPTPFEPEDEEEEETTIAGVALGFTSLASWLVKDPTRNERQEGDPFGPFFPAVAVRAVAPAGEEPPPATDSTRPASIIVFGDSDFASNRWITSAGNNDLFLNSVNWLVGDIDLQRIRPKVFAFRGLSLTRNERHFVRYSSWFLLPFLMALLGGFVWWRRR